MPQVYIAIGSNIDRDNNIRGAVRQLSDSFGRLTLSPIYESKAHGFVGGNFYNLVAGFTTTNSIERIKATVSRIEAQFGREREAGRMDSRQLDLDLLLYDDIVLHDSHVNLPHPDIQRYAFVLRPLADIAPDLKHPETGLTYAQMWKQFNKDEQVIRVVNFKY